jgi:hypothetical protein
VVFEFFAEMGYFGGKLAVSSGNGVPRCRFAETLCRFAETLCRFAETLCRFAETLCHFAEPLCRFAVPLCRRAVPSSARRAGIPSSRARPFTPCPTDRIGFAPIRAFSAASPVHTVRRWKTGQSMKQVPTYGYRYCARLLHDRAHFFEKSLRRPVPALPAAGNAATHFPSSPMNDPIPSNQPEAPELASIGRAMRFAIGCVVVGVSWLAINSCLNIPRFGLIYSDMLGENEHLPWLTRFVLGAYPVLLVLSICIPVAAIALLFTRNVVRSLYCLGVLVLVSIVECVVVIYAKYLPLITIFERMQSTGP